MSTGKWTKQQVVEALRPFVSTVCWKQAAGGLSGDKHGDLHMLADALVKAGLAEEPREEGWYWVRWGNSTVRDWCIWYFDGSGWKPSLAAKTADDEPRYIGPKLTPPEE